MAIFTARRVCIAQTMSWQDVRLSVKLTLFKLSSVPYLPLHCATYATLSSVVNFLSTYSGKKSSTTLQNNIAQFVSDS